MAGELGVPLSRSVLEHLIAGCERCRAIAAKLWRGASLASETRDAADVSTQEPSYGPVLERVFDRVRAAADRLATERRNADAVCARLLRHPLERQVLLVQNSGSYLNWGVCERLLQLAREGRFDDPRRVRDLAKVAILISGRLAPERYGEAAVEDLRGRAWTTLAGSQVVLTDFGSAEESLREATAHLDAGSGSLTDRGGWRRSRPP